VLGALVGSTVGKAIDGQLLLVLFALVMIAVGITMLVKRNDPGIEGAHCTRENAPQVKLAPVLETVDQLSQDTLCQVVGHRAIKSRRVIFAVWAREFSRHKALKRPGATATEWRLDTRRRFLASVAQKNSDLLGMSAPDTIGGVEQLKQRIK